MPARRRRFAGALLALLAVCALGGASPAGAATGDISTIAGGGFDGFWGNGGSATSAAMREPVGVAVASDGTMYIADANDHRVRKVSPLGVISTFAGTGTAGYAGDGGAATSAQLNTPADVAIDGAGAVYIADYGNHVVRKVSNGVITRFAGTGTAGYSGNGGQARWAQLSYPLGLDFDAAGSLYIADYGNNRVRKVTAGGVISTVAGNGDTASYGNGGAATSAGMGYPYGVAVDDAGSLYISQFYGHQIRKVTSAGVISRIAGTGTAGYSGNGGAATAAMLNEPAGLDFEPGGDLLVAEHGNHVIRKITPAGVISRIAGIGQSPGYSGDGAQARSAQLNEPYSVTVNPAGSYYIADAANHVVRRVVGFGSPDAPTLTATTPVSPSNANTVAVTGTAPAGTTVTLYSTSSCTGAVVASGSAAQLSSPGISVTVSSDTTTSFYATATDTGSNVSKCSTSSITYVEDSSPPAAPAITAAPVLPSSTSAPSWSFSGEAGASFQCRLDRGGTAVSGWSACASPKAYDLSAEIDGTYTFSVRAVDGAGNVGATTTSTYALDRSAPAAPAITSSPASPSNGSAPSWSFSGEAGASFQCRLDRGGTTVSGWSACATPKAFDLSAQVDGTYTFSVRAIDAAGNTGTAATSTYVLDRSAAGAPSIIASPASPGNVSAPSWSFTGEAGASFQCRLDRDLTTVSGWSACSGTRSYDLSAEPDGTYTFSVRAVDGAGNTGSAAIATYLLDRSAPAAPAITASPVSPGLEPQASWSFTGETEATLECRLDRGATTVSAWSACAGTRTYDLSGEPDGTYTISVRATDTAGNVGAASTSTYVLDRTAPAAPAITAPPTSPGSDELPSWSFSGEAGAGFECRVERDGSAVADWTGCGSPWSFDLSAHPDGSYTVSVRAVDAAGNRSPAAQAAYDLDRAAPAAPSILAAPASPGNGSAPSWSFTGESGASFQCRLDRGATVVSGWGACASGETYDLSAEPDGTYTFSVRARDAAGNVGAEATSDYELDTAEPAAPSITAAPPAQASDDAPSWSFSGEAGAGFECRLERDGTAVLDWTPCTSPTAYDLRTELEGNYTFLVRAVDVAGNTGPAQSSGYILDRVGPPAPVVDAAPSSPGRDATPTWSFSGEAGATFECRVERGADLVADWAPCGSSWTYDLSAQPDGDYTVSVVAIDSAANRSLATQSSYVLDRAAPAAPTIDAAPVSPSPDSAPSWSFSGEPGADFECRIDRGATLVSDWSACASGDSFDLRSEPDGTYTLSVRAIDAAGNAGAAATSDYDFDTTPPATPSITAAPSGASRDDTPSWSFSGEAGVTLECRLQRGATVISDWSSCAGARTYDLTAEPEATYAFSVRAIDPAGNASAPAGDDYELDRTAPAAPSIGAQPASPGRDTTPDWSFSGEPGASFECRLERGPDVIADWTACSSPHGYDLAAEPDGLYTFRVRATDAAGNTGAAGDAAYALDTTPPGSPSITAGPGALGADETPTWQLASDPGTTLECRIRRGATVVEDWAACTSPHTVDLASEPDGDYTFEGRALDAAGNAGAPIGAAYRLDRLVPGAPAIDAAPAPAGSDPHPSWAFSGEAGADFECRVARGATVVSDWSACSSPHALDLSAEPDGLYTFSVLARDGAGNAGPASSGEYRLDRTAPAAPAIDSTPGQKGTGLAPAWAFSGEAGAGFSCRLTRGSAVVSDWAACTSPRAYDLAGQTDGIFTFSVRATDAVGNTGPAQTSDYELDTPEPGTPAIAGTPGPIGFGRSPAWAFTGDAGATFQCRLTRDGAALPGWAPCTSPWTADLAGRPDGVYSFAVRAVDADGEAGPVATSAYELDTTAPAPPLFAGGPGSVGNVRWPGWTISAEAGTTLECRLDRGTSAVQGWTGCSSVVAYDLGAAPDGAYVASARATDRAGNTGPPGAVSYRLDTQAPEAPRFDDRPRSPGRDRTPTWTFSGEPGVRYDCRVEAEHDTVADWAACDSPFRASLSGQDDGSYSLLVRATDAAGNVGAARRASYDLLTRPPAAPTVVARPDASGSDRSPAWSFAERDGLDYECRLQRGGTEAYDWAPCTSPQRYDLNGRSVGEYTFSVRATDAAGNVGAVQSESYQLAAAPAGGGSQAGGGAGSGAAAGPVTRGGSPSRAGDGAASPTRGRRSASRGHDRPRAAGGSRPERPTAAHRPTAGARPPAGRAPHRAAGSRRPASKRHGVADAPVVRNVRRAAAAVAGVVAEHPDKSVFPGSLILIVVAFLSIQNRMDRNDPKLALAPVHADAELEFGPPPTPEAA